MTESITHIEHRQPTTMSEYKIHLENLKRNITVLLDNGVNLSGNSKLFIVACRLECLKELLIQVYVVFICFSANFRLCFSVQTEGNCFIPN